MRPIFSAFIPALCLLLASSISATPPQATFYVSPEGSPTAPGTPDAPCSLEGARELVRKVNGSMKGDIVVNLRGGTYALKAPFTLREDAAVHDSGTGGFNVIYQAYPGETPVLSGGVPITGWTLFDKERNIYRAKAPQGTDSRQLYVNGRRADRARSEPDPKGWTRTEAGWSITDSSMQHWSNIPDMEIVSRASWKHLRCGIASIAGTEVTMKMPGWHSVGTAPREGHPFSGAGAPKADKVAWVENALELLKTPGQWYLDRKTRAVYYIPLPSENMDKATVVMPAIERVLDVSGSDFSHPIHNIQFKGISFAYGTWLGPSGDQGYADNQTGVIWVDDPRLTYKVPGNVSFQFAHNILFERNVIAHMGGSGLDFGHGPQHNILQGNCIHDISCTGIVMGDFDDYKETNPACQSDDNIIRDNYITKVGREYEDGIGICAGYNRHLVIDHNDISGCPYMGISVGWGWSDLGYSFQNTISHNHVHDFMSVLRDGGGIYTLGLQGDPMHPTVWTGNFLEDGNRGAGMYPDERSGFMELSRNVVCKTGKWLNPHIPHDIHVHDNFTDAKIETTPPRPGAKPPKVDPKIVIEKNTLNENPQSLSSGAKAIVAAAGLEPPFADIAAKVVKPDSNNIAPPVAGAAAGKR